MSIQGDGRRSRAAPSLQYYGIFIACIFLLIAARLFHVQVYSARQHKIRSLGNIMQDFATPAPRGDIFDRAGRPLAKNRQVYKLLYVRPSDLDNYFPSRAEKAELEKSSQKPLYLHRESKESLREIQQLAAYLGLPYVELMARCEREASRTFGTVPITIADNLNYNQVVFFEENRDKYPRLLIDEYAFQRVYPLGPAASHLIGYTGMINQADLSSMRALGYPQDETVGRDGAERSFESMLHGRPGVRYIRLNRSGLGVDFLRENPADRSSSQYQVTPVKGNDLYLTIDAGVQQKAYDLLNGRRGAIVVNALMPGHEGEIIALTSSPSFDPERIKEGNYYTRLNTDDLNTPLVNRAINMIAPPGSTFKLVTLTAALQTKSYGLGSTFYCPGHMQIGNKVFKCHHESGHHSLDLLMGFAESCDVVFYTIGLNLPSRPGTMSDYAKRFGYGFATGIDLAGESQGTVDDQAVKRKKLMSLGYRHESDLRWYDGDNANLSIGQGYMLATPIQVLWSASIAAWDGERYDPVLLYGKRADNRMIRMPSSTAVDRNLDKGAMESLRKAMRAAVSAGTCKQLNIGGMNVCAKSGTAETGKRGEADHSWVVGFYPADAPRYGFVAFFQNGGSSGEAAIPAAAQLLKYMKSHEPIEAPSARALN